MKAVLEGPKCGRHPQNLWADEVHLCHKLGHPRLPFCGKVCFIAVLHGKADVVESSAVQLFLLVLLLVLLLVRCTHA